MMKRLAVLSVLAVTALGVATSAAAYVTPPTDASGIHSMITCLRSGGVIGGSFDSKGAITSSTDLWLSLGWGATTTSQVNNFLAAEYGSVVISNYDASTQTIGSSVRSISWGDASAKKETDVSLWTAPAQVNNPSQNGGKPFAQTRFLWEVGGLASGTYWVSPDFELIKTVFDGSTSVKAGPWDTTGCELDVG